MSPRICWFFLAWTTASLADDQVLLIDAGPDVIANGQALVATANSINDASSAKPYLIELGPGSFNISPAQLTLKPFVSLAGKGRSISQIFLNTSSTLAAVRLNGNNTLRDLHLQHLGSGSTNVYTMGVQVAPGAKSIRLERISVLADGNGLSAGLYVAGDLNATDILVVAQTGTMASAFYYTGSGVVDIADSHFSATNSGAGNAETLYGFSASNPSWQLRNVRLNASHPTQSAFWLNASLSAAPVFRGLEVLSGKRGSTATCLASIGTTSAGFTDFIPSGCPQ